MMKYYFWDMDHTIINNDCDVSWKEFLISEGIADQNAKQLADQFYEDYKNNCLDDEAFMAFQLEEFVGKTIDQMTVLCLAHFDKVVKQTIYQEAREMISNQLGEGHFVSLLTATNDVIAKPLADELGVKNIIATNLEMIDGKFTGKTSGIYCCAEGKLERLKLYCETQNIDLNDVHYYGDSSSDIPVLEAVAYPFACNPMESLRRKAMAENWPILDFNKA